MIVRAKDAQRENSVVMVRAKDTWHGLQNGKTKKQQKYERKQEEAKLGDGTGYSLKDDPRFKNLF